MILTFKVEGRDVTLELTSVKVQTHVSFAGWVSLPAKEIQALKMYTVLNAVPG